VYEALAVEIKAFPSIMGDESPCAIKNPVVIGLGYRQDLAAVIADVLGSRLSAGPR
jgi:hypothetical protein